MTSTILRALASETGLSEGDLLRIVRTAPRRYKVFFIPKRSGGLREIAQPARELKMLQRIFVDRFLSLLPVHSAACAYRPTRSIYNNAIIHAGNGPILKMDFKDFFPSIRARDWVDYCARTNIFQDDAEDIEISTNILFRRKKHSRIMSLSIGAPSSPALSNILLHDFDALIQAKALKRRISYTRYADDITFSGQRIGMLKDMLDEVKAVLREIKRPRLTINGDKTSFVTASRRRFVTGVTLANDGSLSLGRDRKRRISATVHRAKSGGLDGEETAKLAGELAFANVVEPAFLMRLRKKYGSSLIKKIQASPRLKRAPSIN